MRNFRSEISPGISFKMDRLQVNLHSLRLSILSIIGPKRDAEIPSDFEAYSDFGVIFNSGVDSDSGPVSDSGTDSGANS